MQLPTRSKLIRALYDRLNLGGVFLGEVACMAAMGSAHGTALVFNFDDEGVEVAAVNDFSLVSSAVEYHPLPPLKSSNTDDISSILSNRNDITGLSLIDVIESVLRRVESDRRSITLNNLILNGKFHVPFQDLCFNLHKIIASSSILAVSDYPADTQPAAFAFRSIPEYYVDIKETGVEDIAWFGASIAGKYAHSDSKTFIVPK